MLDPSIFFKLSRQGILPIYKKVLLQEVQGWGPELINTLAIPLTFFLAFGLGLRDYIGDVDGVSYMAFIAPGLISMTVLMEAYRSGAWGLWLDRWHQKMIDEYRIKPVSTSDIIIGQILGGFSVALIKGAIVATILLLLSNVSIPWQNLPPYLLLMFPGSIVFTCLGALVGTTLPKPDNIAQSQTIFITPLLYLGGLFFPIDSLPDWILPTVRWLPTTAIFDGGRNLLLKGEIDPQYVLVLALSAILLFVFATWWFNTRLAE
ncbi:MAG: ABC transporter permease [Vampirovibrionales bacterium]|nr:ABC transporter permease [Vampirovibrionales bacterium]